MLLTAAILFPALATTPVAAAGLAKPPDEACAYLDEEGLGTADAYREYREGKYYCWSLRKNLPAGDPQRHVVRYSAEGSADEVSSLLLDLRVVSRSEVQRAHKLFLEYARALGKKALGEDLPEEVGKAVMSAKPGRWPVAGAEVVIEKAHVEGAAYNLLFRIE
jgi:hypothetical protein